MKIVLLFAIYTALLSIASVIVTIIDKIRAINHQWRVPENTLLILSALGGSAAMYLTMLVIRHKTKHTKFMLGIPIIMLFQGIALWYVFIYQGVVPIPV